MDASTAFQLLIALFVGLLCLAAAWDVHAYRIPNRIVLAVAMLYPAFVLAAPQPVAWLPALGVAAAVFAFGLALFAFGLMGGGDVKLMTAVALWAGPAYGLDFVLLTTLAGGAMALFLRSPVAMSLALVAERRGDAGMRDALLTNALPYGLAIAAGGLYVGARLLGG